MSSGAGRGQGGRRGTQRDSWWLTATPPSVPGGNSARIWGYLITSRSSQGGGVTLEGVSIVVRQEKQWNWKRRLGWWLHLVFLKAFSNCSDSMTGDQLSCWLSVTSPVWKIWAALTTLQQGQGIGHGWLTEQYPVTHNSAILLFLPVLVGIACVQVGKCCPLWTQLV